MDILWKQKRYSRNSQIARVLNEMGIVRELNEGVKRIYSEIQRLFLKAPIYSEPDRNSVLLVLDYIVMHSRRKEESMLKDNTIQDKWKNLNYLERQVLTTIFDKGKISSEETAKNNK